MQKVTWLHRLGLVSAVVAVGLAIAPVVASHADGYDTPRSATARGAGSTYAAGLAAAEQRARQDVLAVGHDCTPGTYSSLLIYSSPGGGTWVFESTHNAMCVD
ncbi:hypothetical protein Nocox_00290 [Nonomuraea coxensis DSM 45129]|uniref:Uncharacterized protein n=1 Tax=Nonomuraea coxensis DSM 45129 TaxID=1122611 RepID=A0ABX8TQW2_9ACTN|nr:hypothetical protein [Nonomuraea coxensis]QYC37697.1 hypothetical protein Nocox_00290 [Nonomuraea coxensis DSM 45129]